MTVERIEIGNASIAAAVDFAAEAQSAQLVIVRGADILVDQAWQPEPVDVFAVQKGLVSLLCGMAEGQGLLRLDDPVSALLGAGWTSLAEAAEQRLTIAAVLNMTTGMDDELAPLGEVGTSWRYNNVAYNYLKTALEAATGATLSEITRDWLLDPLGMASTRWVDREVMRPDGRPITALESTAADLVRFGAMVLGGGQEHVTAEYVDTLAQPGSEENPAWGRSWWNNGEHHHRLPRSESVNLPGPLIPEAPGDTILARGALENRLYIVPSLDLVIARTVTPSRSYEPVGFDRGFWSALLG
ncbi:MAG: serine hydrolase [Actinomycetota bacterium]